jgi:outer membrane protein insertion porin family
MALLRAALLIFGLLSAMLGPLSVALVAGEPSARAQPAPPERREKAPPSLGPTPGSVAVHTREETAQSSTIPDLDDRTDLPLIGKPVRRVEVVVTGGRWASRPVVTSVRAGEPLSLDAGRRATRELLDSGRFARAAADAYAEGDLAILRVYALPRRLIAAVMVNGGTLVKADTLEAAELTDGGEITAPALDQVGPRIARYYAAHGYPSARVTVDTTDTDDPGKVVLSIDITPGPPRTVARRIFVIEPAFDREVGALKTRYRVEPGARIDDVGLGDADRDLADVLRQAGFLRAEVRHAVRASAGNSYLYIYVDSGPRIVPTFDGNRAFDGDALTASLNLAKAPDGRASELRDRLRRFYVDRGFLDAEVTATEQGKPEDARHFILFSIVEHPQVRVVRRVFPCLTGDISADDVGAEIEAVLREELPGTDLFSPGFPRVVSSLVGATAGGGAAGVTLAPLATYAPETYERAVKHLRDVAHSRGYLNAVVGPVSVLRATCSKRSPSGRCLPEPLSAPRSACRKDALGLPLPEPPLPEGLICRPDPAHDVACSPEITLRVPVALGPKTMLYDLAFEGNRGRTEAQLEGLAALSLGSLLSTVAVDEARARILDDYRQAGYAYADVRATLEPSPDCTRARVRFSITERDQVYVSGFVVKGARRTDERLILGRVALRRGLPYRQEQARRTEERIAALGTFSSVSVSLEDDDVPQPHKRVIITVVEQPTQYLEPRIGFSSGEGARLAFEYGDRNIGGLAVGLTLRLQLSYLFDFLILDGDVKSNYLTLPIGERLEARATGALNFPEIGLGPLMNLSLEAIGLQHLQRDFRLFKGAIVPTLSYRPRRAITTQLGVSAEINDLNTFTTSTSQDPNFLRPPLLRIPEGASFVAAQRASFTLDLRDNPFNATRGVFFSTSVEHVDSYPLGASDGTATATKAEGHFLRLAGRFSFYASVPRQVTLAVSLAAGYNLQLTSQSTTYPDRLFFLGGVDSIRSYLADSVIPQDLVDNVAESVAFCAMNKYQSTTDHKCSYGDIAIRGGNLMLNPRAELRIPITDLVQLGLFIDAGNVWLDPTKVDLLKLRYGVGPGIRLITPVGPIAFDIGFTPTPPWLASAPVTSTFHFSIGLF